MALALYDRVQETGTANTTVSFTLSGAVAGFQSFSVIGNGNTTYYSATDSSGNWEVGLGTYSTSGPTLTRTTIFSSSNAGSAVTFSGTVTVFVTQPASYTVVSSNNPGTSGYVLTSGGSGVAPTWVAAGGGGGGSYDVQTFTSSGTWTKPSGVNNVRVVAIGGGGGGGSGRKGAVSSARAGGGGGQTGGYANFILQASDLTSTVTVTIGTGGTGGASQATNSTSGNDGTSGGNTTFGTYIFAFGGSRGRGGLASTTSPNYIAPTNSEIVPNIYKTTAATIYGTGASINSGGIANANSAGGTGGNWGMYAGGSGGAGGAIDTSNIISTIVGFGGTGSLVINSGFAGGTASTVDGTAGGNGTAANVSTPYGGGGGGGGQSSLLTNAGAGGNGGLYGGGGGGGGASVNSVGNSGAGGNGAAGIVVVISW